MVRVRIWKPMILLAVVPLSFLGPISTRAGADATGCSYYSGSPGLDGDPVCQGQSGSCYVCEYSYGGSGYTVCSETGDGTGVSYCVDYQY